MTEEEFIHKELTYKIIGCAMKVHTELGYGFLEKVYENSLMLLLHKEKIVGKQQFSIPVYFQVPEWVTMLPISSSKRVLLLK